MVTATGIGIVLALMVDIITGRWVGSPWLHILLAGLIVAAWLPWASRVKYLQWAPLYVLGLLSTRCCDRSRTKRRLPRAMIS